MHQNRYFIRSQFYYRQLQNYLGLLGSPSVNSSDEECVHGLSWASTLGASRRHRSGLAARPASSYWYPQKWCEKLDASFVGQTGASESTDQLVETVTGRLPSPLPMPICAVVRGIFVPYTMSGEANRHPILLILPILPREASLMRIFISLKSNTPSELGP